MSKKKTRVMISIGFVAMIFIAVYWFYFANPSPFPSKQVVKEDINSFLYQSKVNVIQDTVKIDEKHVLVPFISKNDEYGLSYWVWKHHQWKVLRIETKGGMMLWQIDKSDPSSYHFVWNIHPDDQVSAADFYLIKDRGYQITEGVHHYYPRIQMKKSLSLEDSSYGTMQLPSDWVTFIQAFQSVEKAKQPDGYFEHIFHQRYMLFGWYPVDQNGESIFPEMSVNGGGFSNGNIDLEHVSLVDEIDIEKAE